MPLGATLHCWGLLDSCSGRCVWVLYRNIGVGYKATDHRGNVTTPDEQRSNRGLRSFPFEGPVDRETEGLFTVKDTKPDA